MCGWFLTRRFKVVCLLTDDLNMIPECASAEPIFQFEKSTVLITGKKKAETHRGDKKNGIPT